LKEQGLLSGWGLVQWPAAAGDFRATSRLMTQARPGIQRIIEKEG
jgi:hypothetical protein